MSGDGQKGARPRNAGTPAGTPGSSVCRSCSPGHATGPRAPSAPQATCPALGTPRQTRWRRFPPVLPETPGRRHQNAGRRTLDGAAWLRFRRPGDKGAHPPRGWSEASGGDSARRDPQTRGWKGGAMAGGGGRGGTSGGRRNVLERRRFRQTPLEALSQHAGVTST